MLATRTPNRRPVLAAPERNHYFYGKLLDVHHFELETQYLNAKRWLLNRLVTGYGVVCGLDVDPGEETNELWLSPGVAIDRWGREIIVDRRTGPIVIPARFLGEDEDEEDEGGDGDEPASQYGEVEQDDEEQAEESDYRQERKGRRGRSATASDAYGDRPKAYGDRPKGYDDRRRRPTDDGGRYGTRGYGDDEEREHDRWVQVWLCYDECESDPTPVFAGDCDSAQLCLPGTIRERFHIEFREGRHPRPDPECLAPEFFPDDRLNYGALARFVTEWCPDVPEDPCIVLANVKVHGRRHGHECDRDNIDITVRPVVYGNDLLFKLLLSDDDEDRERRDYREKG